MFHSSAVRKLRIPGLAMGVAGTFAALAIFTGTAAQAASNVGNIGYGAHGPGVWCVQQALDFAASNGWIPASPTVDGFFGTQTKLAVKEFQAQDLKNAPVDGIVGPITGQALLQAEWDNGHTEWVQECFPYIPSAPGTTFT